MRPRDSEPESLPWPRSRNLRAHAPRELGLRPQPEHLIALMRRVAARDVAAFTEFYDLTVDRVFALAHCILRSRTDAEDVVCETYERTWHDANHYAAERGDVLGWLLSICRSRAIDVTRRWRNERRLHSALTGCNGTDAFATLSPEGFEHGHSIVTALSEMPVLRQRILALAFCGGLSHREIATQLGLPIGTVKSHLRRAIQDLRASLGLGPCERARMTRWH